MFVGSSKFDFKAWTKDPEMLRIPTRRGQIRAGVVIALVLFGLVALGVVTKGVARTWPRWFSSPVVPGYQAYDRGDWDGAFKVAREYLKTKPDDLESLRLLARASARLGRDDSARAIFTRLGPETWKPEDHFVLGLVIRRARQRALAEDSFKLALDADPNHAEALHALVVIARTKQEPLAAAAFAERLAGRQGWRVVGNALLGELRDELADPLRAEAAYRRALAGSPFPSPNGGAVRAALESMKVGPPLSGDDLHKRLARALLRLGRPSEARTELTGLPPSDPERSWLLARAALHAGEKVNPDLASEAAAYRSAHPNEPEPAPYVGSASCTECHRSLSLTQQKSLHARTFARAGDKALAGLPLPPPGTADPYKPDARHTLSRSTEGLAFETKFGRHVYRAVVAYAFGSGDRGLSLVGRDTSGHDRELRLSRYADLGESRAGWDLTTGHTPHPELSEGYLGRPLSADSARGCLLCHTTEPHAATVATSPTYADHGIGCEKCHGPGGHHESAVATGQPEFAIASGKGRAPAAEVNRQCGQCHGSRGETFDPGESASLRFQVNMLAASRCGTESGEGLSCVACHDPHRDAETTPKSYETVCLSCHGSGKTAKTLCPVNKASDCLKCHMPVVKTPMIPHSPFTDHRIRVRKGG